MSTEKSACAYCQRTGDEVPLLTLNYQEKTSWICPQHLPVLIHKPEKLIGKVPGVENLADEGCDH